MRLWAHRGSHGPAGALENTLPAFARALADRADGIELDVHVTADGVPVVFHDDDLARLTSDADGRRLSDLTAAEVRAVRLVGGARAPTLAQVLDLVGGRVPVNVELKDAAAVGPVARLLERRGGRDEVLLSSFDVRAMQAASEQMPRVRRAVVMGTRTLDPVVRLRETLPQQTLRLVGASAWHPHAWLVRRGLVEALHRVGIEVNVWTVNDRATLARLGQAGVDGVFTDMPHALRRFLRNTPAR